MISRINKLSMKHNLIPTAYKLYRTYKYQIIRGSGLILVLGAGCYISYTAGQHSRSIPVHTLATPGNASMETVVQATLDGSPQFAFPPYVSGSQATPANAGLMSLDLLNLAYLYEYGADTSDPSFSYAGRLYSHLSEMDAKWSASMNDLYNYTPERLAVQMGLPIQAVTAGSGIIPEFTKVNIQFLDGDGHATSHTSNARDIIAMANTLYYYGVLNNMDELEAYADKLWKDSHHYTLHMGDIYNCDGSCRKADETPAETTGSSQAENQETVSTDGPGNASGPGAAAESGGAEVNSDVSAAEDSAARGSAEEKAPIGADTPAGGASISAGVSAAEDALIAGGGTAAGSAAAGSTAAGAAAESAAADAASAMSSKADTTQPGNAIGPADGDTGSDDTVLSEKPYQKPGSSKHTGLPTEQPGQASGEAMDSGTAANAQSDDSPCPGHIDLSITIEVKGTSESNGLFPVDTAHLNGEKPSGWQGWNKTAMEAVRAMCVRDWYEEYGINTADSIFRNPLTSEDINGYMAMVPENVSQIRKDFIKYALTSVGKIPYYWGGKPSKPGYTGNDFGSIISPDEDERFLKGLDCSGWINWLYWSISGHGLGAESTGTLLSSGTATTKSQLIPGDICIRTGSRPHVVVFLGWAEDGQMWCIQETSGNINNVEVGVTTGDWQSYRRILD